MSQLPSPEQIATALEHMPGWSGDADALEASWTFADFPTALGFMSACVEGIEQRGHHPEWSNVYNRVSVRLRTHDLGDKVSAKDLDLAAFLSAQAANHGAH
ncbi:MAG: 4a-hydroxytetrahydrobiopterin dehydratase [Planctomycetota bacterium]|jgi:4a-hydroxytetrahydrobiopterin dehydratase|nr:4a-hydroxytetrahydrobiopterin dehydratase [Planctomycetota bacterium]